MNHIYTFRIAGVVISFESPEPINVTERFRIFQTEAEKGAYTVTFDKVDKLPYIKGRLLYQGVSYKVYIKENGTQFRKFADVLREKDPFSLAEYDWAKKNIRISYVDKGRSVMTEIDNCFFQIAWEKLMCQENRVILHAACIETEYGGVLFTGPSGIGKSTQARLWIQMRNARMINGDRTILHDEKSGWKGYGSPYAGSSKCYVDEYCTIKAIVCLRQSERSKIRIINGGEAFQKIYSEMTANSWDRSFVEKVCDLTCKLIRDIPVFELSCTPDENAICLLESELKKQVD